MKPIDFSLLSISQYQIKLKTKGTAKLPIFLGSTLRGAFGHALKDTVCIVNHRNCEKCIVADKCSYPYLFETFLTKTNLLTRSTDINSTTQNNQHIPHPFILSLPLKTTANPSDHQIFAPESELTFNLTLIGRAIEYFPYIVYSIDKMANRGLGLKNRTSFELDQVLSLNSDLPQVIYDGQTQKLSSTSPTKLSSLIEQRLKTLTNSTPQQITLQFLTPNRIRMQNHLQKEISFSLLIINLLRRVFLLCQFHGEELWQQNFSGLLNLASGVETKFNNLKWWDFERYSNRQKTYMKLGGFIGTTTYVGEAIETLLPLIVAGEFLHVGGSTSFGLGKYRIID